MEKAPRKPGIYLLICTINKIFYLGRTNNLQRRFGEHKRSPDNPRCKNSLIARAIGKHGWDNFDICIIETQEIYDKELLNQREKMWIKKLNSTDRSIGYNITSGGDGGGYPLTEEHKAKFNFKGHKHSLESRKKMSEAHSGENSYMFGKHLSEETKKKLSLSKIGKRTGSSNHNYGKPVSDEIKLKISKSRSGKCTKKVKQIDEKTGEVIKVWNSIVEATLSFGKTKNCASFIVRVCRGIKKRAYGFKWEYA